MDIDIKAPTVSESTVTLPSINVNGLFAGPEYVSNVVELVATSS